jgi:type IV conjugative transfer system protein TraL
MYNRNVILRYIDAPSRIAFWTMDEARGLLIPASLGFLFGFPLIGLVLSIACYSGLKVAKQNLGGGLLKHAAYWYLPKVDRRLKVKIRSEIREYIG